eukprot:437372_1
MSTKIEPPLAFPQTYAQLLVIFLIIPTLIFTFYPTSLLKHAAFKKIAKLIPFLLVIAIIQAAIWDNYGTYVGIWTFSDRVLGHIGFLPLEEYTWILMQVLISVIFTLRMWISLSFKAFYKPQIDTKKCLLFTLIGAIVYLILMVYGANSLHSYLTDESNENNKSFLCSGIILSFFVPFILLQWFVFSKIFYQNKIIWLLSWSIPGIYTYLIDCLAVHQKIWTFDYSYTHNIWLFGCVNTDILMLYIIATQICSFPILGYLATPPQYHQKNK